MPKRRFARMFPIALVVAAVLGLGLLAGCSKGDQKSALESAAKTVNEVKEALTSADLDMVQKAAVVSAAIAKAPDTAAAILEEHGLTKAEFDVMMEKIKNNDALKAAYDKAVAAL